MAEQIEIPSFYSNSVGLISSYYDFILTFNVNEPYKEKGKVVNQLRPLVRISMSPTHFKAFAIMCMDNVKAYEKQFGEIKRPKPPKRTKGKSR